MRALREIWEGRYGSMLAAVIPPTQIRNTGGTCFGYCRKRQVHLRGYRGLGAAARRDMTFGTVSAVATDSQDRVYAFQRADPPVVIFDREGNYLVGSWGEGRYENPHGIYIADDIVYLTDREGSIAQKCTLDGTPLLTIGTPGVYSDTGCEVAGEVCPRSAGPFNYLTELVPSPSGDLYVSDGYRNARVHRFSAAGDLISSWGEPGKGGPNQFHLPHSLIVGQDGRIYLCDRENSRVQVFSPEGEYITMWTDMQRPLDISQDSEGIFYTSERPKIRQAAPDQRAGRRGQRAGAVPGTLGPRLLGGRPRRPLPGPHRREEHRQVRPRKLIP